MQEERAKEAVNIIESELDRIRGAYDDSDKDPFADVRITVEDDHVLFTYDGAGFDYYSYYGQANSSRDRLRRRMAKAGFLVEDRNNWSTTIWDERH